MHLLAPTMVMFELAGHCEHMEAPGAPEYVPTLQAMQVLLVVTPVAWLYVPEIQDVHWAALANPVWLL